MKKLIAVLSIIAALVIYSCTTPMKSFNSNSNGWKQNDFIPSKGILLIEKSIPKNQQKKIEEFMAKNYPYKYEFIETKDLSQMDTKYQDKTLYRFALVSSYSTHNIHQLDIGKRALDVTEFDFNFLDRLNNKEYPKSGIASSWASMTFKKIIETCLKN